jgi:hypothetical protein
VNERRWADEAHFRLETTVLGQDSVYSEHAFLRINDLRLVFSIHTLQSFLRD